jgi:hypothetical protein
MGGKVVKGISKRLLRGRGGVGQSLLHFNAENAQAFRGINFYPDGSKIGTNNCIYCAVNTDKALKTGVIEPAIGDGNIFSPILNDMFGKPNSNLKYPQIVAELAKTPHSTGIIEMRPPGGELGHVFNVFNDGGTIRAFDSQQGQEILDISAYLKRHGAGRDGFFLKFYNTTDK